MKLRKAKNDQKCRICNKRISKGKLSVEFFGGFKAGNLFMHKDCLVNETYDILKQEREWFCNE